MEKALADPGPYLTTLLVGTNLAIIGGTVAATRLAEDIVPGRGEIVATLVLSPLFLVFSEVLPKSYFLAHARSMCLQIVPPLEFLRHLFRPLVVFAGAPARMLGFSEPDRRQLITREELVLLTRLGPARARVSRAVGHILEKGIARHRSLASELMISRVDVVELPAASTVQEVSAVIQSTRFSRYPLENNGTWVGLVHVLDLIGSPGNEALQSVSHPLPSVAPSAGLEQILACMRDAGEHMVAVKDGGVFKGIITLDVVLDHLTAELDGESTP
jgi:putative hemolysin